MSASALRQESQDFTIVFLRTGEGISFATHEGEIFRKGDETRTPLSGFEDALFGRGEVGGQIIGRTNLNDSD